MYYLCTTCLQCYLLSFPFDFQLIKIVLAPAPGILYSVLKQSLISAGLQWYQLHIRAQINTPVIILHYF